MKIFYTSLISYIIVLLGLIIGQTFDSQPLDIGSLLFFSITYTLPIFAMLNFGFKYKEKNPDSDKIYSEVSIYSIGPSFITALLFVLGYGFVFNSNAEAGFIIFGLPIVLIVSAVVYSLISLLLTALINYLK